MINTINTNFKVSEKDIKDFNEKGFLLLKGIFSKELIEYLQSKILLELQAPSDRYQSGFNRVKYDIFEKDENVHNILKNETFKSTMRQLTKRSLIFTQALAFELKRNDSKGFPWHIGTQSFGFSVRLIKSRL